MERLHRRILPYGIDIAVNPLMEIADSSVKCLLPSNNFGTKRVRVEGEEKILAITA